MGQRNGKSQIVYELKMCPGWVLYGGKWLVVQMKTIENVDKMVLSKSIRSYG